MLNNHFDVEGFEKEWRVLGEEICQAVFKNPDIQQIKANFQQNGFLSLEEKSQFINICDRIKYELIYRKYGAEGTEGYKQFSNSWQAWFQAKGVKSQKPNEQRTNVDHILYGSTPDPEQFLNGFEQEQKSN